MTRTEMQTHRKTLATLNESRAARNIADAITRGTTTPAENVVVLWIGEHLVLYKHHYSNSGSDTYYSPFVALRDKERLGLSYRDFRSHVDFEGGSKDEVWNCAKERDGRLGLNQILDLIERAKEMDARYPEIEATRSEAERKIDEEREQKYAEQRAERLKREALRRAAPDLLEAAKNLVRVIEAAEVGDSPAVEALRVAVAKAETIGEE